MTSSTLVWDVASGLVVGTILCVFAFVWFRHGLKLGPKATVAEYTRYFFGSIFAGSVGMAMLIWSLIHLPEAWLLLVW